MKQSLIVVVLVVLVGGCMQDQAGPAESGPGGRLSVSVAPLSLEGVSDACYSLAVFNGTNPLTWSPVWERTRVCSSRFGDAKGGLSYVGTCDASGSGVSSVRLVMEDLCANGPCPEVVGGTNSLPASQWRNPCPAPGGCVQEATCSANADVPVSFDLTIARSAQQGFFDVAVGFEDIFCSAKLDCRDEENGPLLLLHDPADGQRKQTVVVAWACSAGAGQATSLYYDNLVLRCFGADDALIGEWAYDPSLGPGNAGPGAAPFVFQTGVYRTQTQTSGVVSWNMAFGIRPENLPGRCVLSARATASEGNLENQETPSGAIYPYIAWDVQLSATAGALSCTRHALDVGGSGVVTDYVRVARKRFTHAMSGATMQVASLGRQACGGVIESLDGRVSFGVQPEGITARVGDVQSAFYELPDGYELTGCCGDPCCEGPGAQGR